MSRASPVADPDRDAAAQVEPRFLLRPWPIARLLLLGTALLTVAHLFFSINYLYIGWIFPGSTFLYVLFDLHGEVTIPTWYSSMLLLLCALVLTGMAVLTFREHDHFRFHWAGLALIFLGLSIEESADIHGAVSRQLQVAFETGGVLTYPWVVPAAIFTLVIGAFYLRFLRNLEPRYRWWFLIAGGIYIFGALGMEVIEAAYDSAVGDDGIYLAMVTIEEVLEMIGAIVVLAGILTYASDRWQSVRLEIARDSS